MSTQLPTRAAIDAAGDIDFNAPRGEKQANISLTAGPSGLTVTVEWTGPMCGIPAAVERLRAAGVLELVTKAAPVHTAPLNGHKPRAERVTPAYDGNGDPCCPNHTGRPLKMGKYGWYCSAKDRETGEYCSLKFAEG